MGWNDRLMEDPYTPPPEYYRDRDEYEAWLEYVEMQLEAETGLTSQNIDPLTLLKPNNDQNQEQTEKKNRANEKDARRIDQNVEADSIAEFPF